jgi:hypothetical protein
MALTPRCGGLRGSNARGASAFMGVPWAYSSYTELWKAELMQHATRAFAHSAGASGGA